MLVHQRLLLLLNWLLLYLEKVDLLRLSVLNAIPHRVVVIVKKVIVSAVAKPVLTCLILVQFV